MMKFGRRFMGALVAAAAAMPLVAPATASAQTTLKAALHSDLKIIDPVWTSALITTNHGYMVYDTLFAVDDKLEVKPQMVDKNLETDREVTLEYENIDDNNFEIPKHENVLIDLIEQKRAADMSDKVRKT